MKKSFFILIGLAVLALIFFGVKNFSNREAQNGLANFPVLSNDYKNAEYLIEGKKIKLGDEGTRYFGNEVRHDLNDDGREDVVFLLTQNTGGSGTFFYVVAALNTPAGYVGSEAVFLGDRIAPQTTEINEEKIVEGRTRQNVVVVNYAIRRPGEPFTTQPSVGKSLWLKLDPTTMQFGEVVPNFEGESR